MTETDILQEMDVSTRRQRISSYHGFG